MFDFEEFCIFFIFFERCKISGLVNKIRINFAALDWFLSKYYLLSKRCETQVNFNANGMKSK